MNRNLIIAAAGGASLVLAVGYLTISTRQEPPMVSADSDSDKVPAAAALTDMAATDLGNGKTVYDYWCAACHDPGPGHPGTQSLEVKYGGEVPAALVDRTDLAPETTAYFVRNGYALMPFFRKTEISDDDLRGLAAYLAKKG